MRLSLIAAMARNRVIGRAGAIPWHLPDDLRHFKQITMGRWLIMGRRTFESIGRPLPGRTTVVVTRRPDYAPDGVIIAHSIEEALELARGEEEVFVAGGAQIYEATLPIAERLHLTLIEAEYEGDAFFPTLDYARWRLAREEHRPAAGNAPAHSFATYERI
ncbi:MAG TPA: dihydrofolate reductase [Candidatus Polarisedimenticolia bacterium]|jgi:dihydrofolate reductase